MALSCMGVARRGRAPAEIRPVWRRVNVTRLKKQIGHPPLRPGAQKFLFRWEGGVGSWREKPGQNRFHSPQREHGPFRVERSFLEGHELCRSRGQVSRHAEGCSEGP